MRKIKKIYLIVGVSIGIFLLIVIVGILTNKQDKSSVENITNQQNQGLTPIVTQNQKQPDVFKVKSAFPVNNETGVSTTKRIVVIFDFDLPEEPKNSISVTTSPSFGFATSWDNNRTLVITPSTELKTETKYTITIKGEKINSYVLSFTTIEYTSQEVNEQIKQQAEDDINFTETLNKFNSSNPWYKSLPITTNDYMVVYDFTKKQFAIGISTDVSESNKDKVVEQAVGEIKKIYPILEDDGYYVLQ